MYPTRSGRPCRGKTVRSVASALALGLLLVPCGARPDATEVVPWQIGITLTGSFFRDQAALIQPTVTADHGWLHLEGRYGYEARDAGSAWVGWNLAWTGALSFALAPMIGVVVGSVNGLAPGIEWDLRWGPLELESTNEFVFDLGNWPESDFNYWAEARIWPWEWLRTGIAVQHSKAVQVARQVQWGPLLGGKAWKLDGSVYWMNLDQPSSSFWMASLGGTF